MAQVTGPAARILLGLVFYVSGLSKAAAPPEEFAAVLESYRLFPDRVLLPAAAAAGWVELLLGLALIFGFLTRRAAGAGAAMIAVFAAAIASTILRGIPLPHCGCYGRLIELTPVQSLLADGGLFLLAVLAYRGGRNRFTLDAWIEGAPSR